MAKRDSSVYEVCDWCGKTIHFGNAMVDLSRHVEQIDRTPESPDGEVTVIDAESVLSLCAACGNRLDVAAVSKELRAGMGRRTGTAGEGESGEADASNDVGGGLEDGQAELVLTLLGLGLNFEETERPDLAQSVYEAILKWFADATDVPTRLQLAQARVYYAALLEDRGQTEAAASLLDDEAREVGAAAGPRRSVDTPVSSAKTPTRGMTSDRAS